ncbi:MarR family transcriptional regulator [Rhodococcus sp. Q]|uniref:MarR family winged helix-turn-helix transcriptional regulator n=1 Tax=Rhodococcus sp. Q TaxID=2502252 RepID=UPI002016A591|nr:MarR family transcriptional regulator [Rhodococcus sp. Q]
MTNVGPPPSAAFLVMAVGRRMRERVERTLKGEVITMRHLSALGHLSRDAGISYSELARRASVTPQSMQATLAKLEECGAVSRTTDSGRGRTARLVVTDEGMRLLALGQDAIGELDEVLARYLDADTLGKLMPGLLRTMLALGGDERR